MPFIIHHHDDSAICGAGENWSDAWAGWQREMQMARIASPDRADYAARRATPALVQHVRERGGAIAWGTKDGMACTIDEADATADHAV